MKKWYWIILVAVALGTVACTPPTPTVDKTPEQIAFEKKRLRTAEAQFRQRQIQALVEENERLRRQNAARAK